MDFRYYNNKANQNAVVVERQTHYLEGVASNARAGSNPANRTKLKAHNLMDIPPDCELIFYFIEECMVHLLFSKKEKSI